MINIQLYDQVKEIESNQVKNFEKLKEIISESFYIDLSKFIFHFYENDNKVKLNDDESYKKFWDLKGEKKYLYVTNPSYEESILEKCNFSIPSFKNLESTTILHQVNDGIEKIKQVFLKSNHFIYTQIKKYVQTITESSLKVNYDNIKENKKIKKQIKCRYCDETISTDFYFKCGECPNFSICKLCEYRFQNLNHHNHNLLYVKNGEEKNTIFQKEKELKNYTAKEIEELLMKEESFSYDEDYKVTILANKVINIDFKENQEDYEISFTIQNIGEKKINNKMKYGRFNSTKQWYKEIKEFLLFENASYPVPEVNPKESKYYNFKINIKNKTPGKYFCILCLKRNNYYIEGGFIVLEININLQPEDYD